MCLFHVVDGKQNQAVAPALKIKFIIFNKENICITLKRLFIDESLGFAKIEFLG